MPDPRSNESPAAPIEVSPNNPCPFLRALVAEGFVDGHTVPLSTLSRKIEAASGEKGLNKIKARVAAYGIALFANGNPLRSWWSGARLDELRDGPLDKHGAGSRILDASAHVHEEELARLATFGKERAAPDGSLEIGLTKAEITTYMKQIVPAPRTFGTGTTGYSCRVNGRSCSISWARARDDSVISA